MNVINRKQLQSQAGSAAFGRGEGYFESGLVGSLRLHKDGVQAKVSGSYPYRVRLDWRNGFDYRCNCPMGVQGDCCKHCVAVGLAWLSRDAESDSTVDSEDERIRRWLESKKKKQLISMIMEASESDDQLFKRLSLMASASSLDLTALKQSISNTIETDYIDYYEMNSYVDELSSVTDLLESLLVDGHASEVQELSLHAVDCMAEAFENMDDSDGMAASEMECWQEIHFRACQAAPPATDAQREELANMLFEREVNAEWDEFYGSVETYADLLGEAGIAEFTLLVEQAWEKIPVLMPGKKEEYRHDRLKVTSMMESLAKLDGDVDAQIAIKARDLSLPYYFLQIAELLAKANRFDEALDWAEKGVAAFEREPDSRLEEYLAELYTQRKAFGKAVAIIWNVFERQPSVHSWGTLKLFSSKANEWGNKWRQQALDHIRHQISEDKKRGATRWYKPDHSLLVQIFLHENEVESAWLEANEGDCSADLWKRLGEKLGDSEPLQATFCWQRLVEPIINRKNNASYVEAVQMMLAIGAWMKRADKENAFEHWVQEVRMRHRPKRNLMKIMNEEKL